MANIGANNVFFELIKILPYGDKIGHIFLFGFLVLGINISFRFYKLNIGKINTYLGTFLVVIFALLEELSQYFIPSRTLDVYDFVADVIGISIFTLISFVLDKLCNRKFNLSHNIND